ncbi:MAG: hypothetical protein V4494_07955 [Chlamydiota bacterium]
MSINSEIKMGFLGSLCPVESTIFSEILEKYEVVFLSPRCASIEEAEVFLFSENHSNELMRKLNGDTISTLIEAFKKDKSSIFLEGYSWEDERLLFSELMQKNKFHIRAFNADFYGWEPLKYLQENQKLLEAIILIRDMHRMMKVLEREYMQLSEISGMKRQLQDMLPILELYQETQQEALANCRALLSHQEQLLQQTQRKIEMLESDLEKSEERLQAIGATQKWVEEQLKQIFPMRTEGMVSTVRQCSILSGKKYFIAGEHHLKTPEELVGIEEYNLNPLFEELHNHKAVILIPKLL